MSAGKQRILVIDDDPDIHLAVKAILGLRGYEVVCCDNGRAGLESMRRDPPDLVLLDVMMATMSEGFHLLYEIRRDPALFRTPVVIVSSVGTDMGFDYAREIGTEYLPADGFLEKPIDASRLTNFVAEMLARGRAAGSECPVTVPGP